MNKHVATSFAANCLVLVDAAVDDYQQLVNGVIDGARVVILQQEQSGIAQITSALAQYPAVSQVHLVSHGESGRLRLGSDMLTADTLADHRQELATWFSQPTDLLLYGCNVAAGDRGMDFVHELSRVTGAAIAASDTLTGNTDRGGDWELDVTIGDIMPALAFKPDTLRDYAGVLIDIADGDTAGLIAAITAANGGGDNVINLATNGTYSFTTFAPGTDTFSFPPIFPYGATALPYITNTITINGNGATISRGSGATDAFRFFLIDGNTTTPVGPYNGAGNLTLNNLTLSGGLTQTIPAPAGVSNDGGAILNYNGTLTADNVRFLNNRATDDGGALSNLYGARATITNSVFQGNSAADGGGAIDNDADGTVNDLSTLNLTNTDFINNTAGTDGGAIRNRSGGSANVTGGTFSGNTALNGGGIFNDPTGAAVPTPQGAVQVGGATFTDNNPNNTQGTIAVTFVNVSLVADTTAINEGAAATFTVTLSAAATQNLVFNFAVSGTATPGSDYSVSGSGATLTGSIGTVTIPTGATTASFALNALTDSIAEPNETVTLSLNSGPDGATQSFILPAASNTASLTINDVPPVNNNPTLTQIQPNIFQVGGGGSLKFTLTQRDTNVVNELGVFVVNGANGNVNGVLPTDPNYIQTALASARRGVIFSALDSLQSLFFGVSNGTRELRFNNGDLLRFYLVKNGTADSVLSGQTAASSVVFSVPNQLQVGGSSLPFTLSWEDGTDNDFNDLVAQISASSSTALIPGTTFQGVREVVDLTGTNGGQASVIGSSAQFNNTFGFYAVTNAITGAITTAAGTFAPGSAQYARQAVLNRVDAANMVAGAVYAPFIIANGTADNFLAGTGVNAFFAYQAANVDGADHVRLLGSNIFGFEDLLGGGDNDFNDVIVQVKVL